jgi:hypothetical protein
MEHLKTLDPNTATKDQSIWKTIDRLALDRKLSALHAKKHVTGRQSYATNSQPFTENSYPILFELERSLADDLAFIAASQPNVDFVSAVAIELDESGSFLRIKLAANEGVNSEVAEMFTNLVEVLKNHAKKGSL